MRVDFAKLFLVAVFSCAGGSACVDGDGDGDGDGTTSGSDGGEGGDWCFQLGTQELCAEGSGCYAEEGLKLSADLDCVETSGFAVCTDMYIGDVSGFVRNKDGECWHVYDLYGTIRVPGWEDAQEIEGDPCGTIEEDLPDCE